MINRKWGELCKQTDSSWGSGPAGVGGQLGGTSGTHRQAEPEPGEEAERLGYCPVRSGSSLHPPRRSRLPPAGAALRPRWAPQAHRAAFLPFLPGRFCSAARVRGVGEQEAVSSPFSWPEALFFGFLGSCPCEPWHCTPAPQGHFPVSMLRRTDCWVGVWPCAGP